MKTVSAPAHTGIVALPREQPPLITLRGGDNEQRPAESFEAILLRLDGPTAERSFRLATE